MTTILKKNHPPYGWTVRIDTTGHSMPLAVYCYSLQHGSMGTVAFRKLWHIDDLKWWRREGPSQRCLVTFSGKTFLLPAGELKFSRK